MGTPVKIDVWQQIYNWVTGAVSTYIPKILAHGSDDSGTNKRIIKTDANGIVQSYDSQVKTLLDTLLGAKADAAVTDPAVAGSTIALIKGIITKLEAIRTNTDQLEGYSDQIEALLTALNGYVDGLESAMTTLNGKDFATQTTLAALKTVTDSLSTTLGQIKSVMDTTGIKKIIDPVMILDKTHITAPVTGVKTVTSITAEVFAGVSRKASRSRICIRNLHPTLRIRVGPSGVTDTTGFAIGPEGTLELDIDPSAFVPIYAVSEAGNINVEVFEA